MSQLKTLETEIRERIGGGTQLRDVPTKEEKRWQELSARIDAIVQDARVRFQRFWKTRKYRKIKGHNALAHKAIIEAMKHNLAHFADCTVEEKQQVANVYKERVNAAMKEEIEHLDFVRSSSPVADAEAVQ